MTYVGSMFSKQNAPLLHQIEAKYGITSKDSLQIMSVFDRFGEPPGVSRYTLQDWQLEQNWLAAAEKAVASPAPSPSATASVAQKVYLGGVSVQSLKFYRQAQKIAALLPHKSTPTQAGDAAIAAAARAMETIQSEWAATWPQVSPEFATVDSSWRATMSAYISAAKATLARYNHPTNASKLSAALVRWRSAIKGTGQTTALIEAQLRRLGLTQ